MEYYLCKKIFDQTKIYSKIDNKKIKIWERQETKKKSKIISINHERAGSQMQFETGSNHPVMRNENSINVNSINFIS